MGAFRGAFRGSFKEAFKGAFRESQIPGSPSCGGDPTEGLNGQLVLKTSIEKYTSDHGGTRGNPGGTRGQPIFQEPRGGGKPPLKAIGTLKMQASLGKNQNLYCVKSRIPLGNLDGDFLHRHYMRYIPERLNDFQKGRRGNFANLRTL